MRVWVSIRVSPHVAVVLGTSIVLYHSQGADTNARNPNNGCASERRFFFSFEENVNWAVSQGLRLPPKKKITR
jgi:hypothetical protein